MLTPASPTSPPSPELVNSDALDAVIDHHGGYYEYLADELLKREESLRPPAPAASELVDRERVGVDSGLCQRDDLRVMRERDHLDARREPAEGSEDSALR